MIAPYYEDETVTLYNGDAAEILAQLEPGTAHLAATDPPYFRVVEAEWDDQWDDAAEFLNWLRTILAGINTATAQRGTLAVFCSPDLAARVEVMTRETWRVMNSIVWRKPDYGRLGQSDKSTLRKFFNTSERIIIAEKQRSDEDDPFRFLQYAGHTVSRDLYADLRAQLCEWRDAASLSNSDIDRLLNTKGMASHYFGGSQWHLPTREAWEKIAAVMNSRNVHPPTFEELRTEYDQRRETFRQERAKYEQHRRAFNSDEATNNLELFTDVWTFDTVPRHNRIASHPTQKPEALMAHLIETMSRPGDLILDPFAGTGTTLHVARQLGRRAIGVELDETYCKAIARRLEQGTLDIQW